MKKMSILVGFFFVLMLCVTFVACDSTPKPEDVKPAVTGESVGKYVDDTVITTKVKALLAADDFLKSFQISVETSKGIVQLTGFVDSQQTIDAADKITRSVEGVIAVNNGLIVK